MTKFDMITSPNQEDLNIPSIRSSKERLRLKFYALLMLIDIVSIVVAFETANLIRFSDPLHPQGRDILTVLLPIFLGIAINSRAYSLDTLLNPRRGLRRALQSLLFAVAIVIGVIFYLKVSVEYSRIIMATGTAIAFLLLAMGRSWTGDVIGRGCNWRFTTDILLVDGVLAPSSTKENILFADRVGLIPSHDDPVILDRAGRLLKNCDRVVLACQPRKRAAWSAMLKGLGIDVEILAPELDQMGALGISRFDNQATVLVSRGPLALRDRIIKRMFDLALAVPATIILLPVFMAIAIAIKIDSPGPVFFCQPRIGRGNRLFNLIKFRTMHTDMLDTHGNRLTVPGDQRVTKAGAFLRRTSLDELPQLFNVLMSHMSIAGPRPHALGALAGGSLYWEVDKSYWYRHAIKPGITGLAQVRGFRGNTFQHSDLSNRLQADLEYLEGWSIWRDIAIVAATARVLMHRNAF